ncbi:MAG: RNHCP domain-containing protein [Deinococcaceae bacterium]
MRRFVAQGKNTGFTCLNCHAEVPPLKRGGLRNHCPHCLFGLHIDIFPGDRANPCLGLLEPVGVDYQAKKGWILIHRCQRCGFLGRNKAALEDDVPDHYEQIVELSRRHF